VIKLGKFPYIQNTGSIKEFIEKIPKMGVPQKINTHSLPTLGFKSTNDRPIVPILKFINFIDGSGSPNQNYKDFRDSTKAGGILAAELKKAYSDLFEIYPDAFEKDDQALKDFFAPTTEAGEQVVLATVNTFKTLCSFANFKSAPKETLEIGETEKEREQKNVQGKPVFPTQTGVTLNVNIQLNLPITDDASVYDKIFKAIKDNLVSRD
jgi:hypothetical protein